MARGKKKPANHGNSNNAISNGADNVDQLTTDLKKLSVQGKKKKSPQEKTNGKNLTPYQGQKSCFGLYECSKCKNEWASSHSWANTWQECLACRAKIYPHRQWSKKKHGKKDGDKPHLQAYCGKCIKIGRYCGSIGDKG